MAINIDTRGVDDLVKKLELLRRKHLPYAVKQALNDMAMEMKSGGGLQENADDQFDYKRSLNFIKAITWADKAKGVRIDNMVSGAGVASRSGKQKVAERMEQQETGGVLKRGYTPLRGARARGDNSGNIRGKNQHKNLDYSGFDLVDRPKHLLMAYLYAAAKNKRAVKMRSRKGKVLIGQTTGGVDVFKQNRKRSKGRMRQSGPVTGFRYKIKFKYSENKGKKVTVKKRPFVAGAGVDSLMNFNKYFKEAADRQMKLAIEWGK